MTADCFSTCGSNENVTQLDLREQLVNGRLRGPIQMVSIPREQVTRLHGIMLDFDPDHYREKNALFDPSDDPQIFFNNLQPVLDRHTLARHAEVRSSGRGLHVLIWLKPHVDLQPANDQIRWDSIVKVVQRSLPVDPAMPGITAMTRPLGSINSKNGKEVVCLREGTPVAPETVEEFVGRLSRAPFSTLCSIHFGVTHLAPCPFCCGKNSHFNALENFGMCYGKCRKVGLRSMMGLPFKMPDKASK